MITLTTDFGNDYYVAELKGIIYSINPDAKVVDVRHNIRRHNILEGAFILSKIWKHFPEGTIHIGVVDPGVGTERKPIIVRTGYCSFVGPDNGLFSMALKDLKNPEFYEIDVKRLRGQIKMGEISRTFHGRDVFAPAAALIDDGVDLTRFCRRTNPIVQLEVDEGTVLYVDSFGNVVVNMEHDLRPGRRVNLMVGGKTFKATAVGTFSEVGDGLGIIRGSHGLLEIILNMGSASELLNVKAGDEIRVEDAV
ncbi:MAG: SAM-dependent chlorinase/fluorinase [Candidatus Altiarchaeota archaeon]